MMTGATRTAPQFDHIVIWQQNRFCRPLEETIECRDRLNANGVRAVSVTERVTSASPTPTKPRETPLWGMKTML